MYLHHSVLFITIAKQTTINLDDNNADQETLSTKFQYKNKVEIDELDGILEHLYDVRNKEKEILKKKGQMYVSTFYEKTNETRSSTKLLTPTQMQLQQQNNGCDSTSNSKEGMLEQFNTQMMSSTSQQSFLNETAPTIATSELLYADCNNTVNQMDYYESDNIKLFRSLLLDVLNNMSYYRFIISKLLYSSRRCLQYQKKRIIDPSSELKKSTLRSLISLSLIFVRDTEVFLRTDNRIFISDKLQKIKEVREQLDYVTIEPECNSSTVDKKILETIKDFNNILLNTTRSILKTSSFQDIIAFCNMYLGHGLLIIRYYDMFSCFVVSLYKISMFFDIHLKDLFKKHLSYPPLPTNNFYSDYSLMKNDIIFFWAFDWLYFFSNYCELPTKSANQKCILSSIKLYPQDFFIQFHLLIYFVLRHLSATQKERFYDDLFVNQIKERIKTALFYVTDESKQSVYDCLLFNIFIKIRDIYSHKIYSQAKRHIIKLIRTTEENIEHTNYLTPAMSNTIDSLIALVLKIVLDDN